MVVPASPHRHTGRRATGSGIGRGVALEILRDGQTLEKRVAIEERPASAVPR